MRAGGCVCGGRLVDVGSAPCVRCHLQCGQCEPVDVRGGDRVVCVFVMVVVSVMELPTVCVLATSIPTRACAVVGGV
jgi:hypothetical protein